MSGEWIEWKGGACPVPIGTKVEVRHRSGGVFLDRAGVKDSFARDWQHSGMMGDILAYRVIDEDKPAALATDGWIDWNGGDCPCGPGAIVEWQTRAMPGDCPREADILDWRHTGGGDDIVAFRVVGQVKLDSEAPDDDRRAIDTQVGGSHYKQMAIQPVEFIHRNGIGFLEGNAIKYLTRWRSKGGIEDLRKARHYIDLLIELEGGGV